MQNKVVTNEDTVPFEEKEQYTSLMEESMKQFPYACGWMVHCAVCQEIMEEEGVEVDENKVEEMKNLYCKKQEYDNMISVEQ